MKVKENFHFVLILCDNIKPSMTVLKMSKFSFLTVLFFFSTFVYISLSQHKFEVNGRLFSFR